jgi:undecaprenyl-diphosphatase
MWKRRMYSRSAVLLLSIGGIALGVTFLKLLFARARPTDVGAIIEETSFSFPSGHSMGSMGLALTIALLMWPTKWRVPVVIACVVYVLIVGFSRMYLGVHYPTDVAAGWLLGAGWVGLVYAIFKSNRRFKL